MKKILLMILCTNLSAIALSAPNIVDCSNSSIPLVDIGTGPQGFGILYDFPSTVVLVNNFVYDKKEEKAWADIVANKTVYRASADCQLKINSGVLCQFDLASAKVQNSRKTSQPTLSSLMKRLSVSVIDKDLATGAVQVIMGMDEKSDNIYHPLQYKNMLEVDNYYFKNCESKDVLEVG